MSDRYQIQSLIGTGATGQVYRAFDNTLNREVALKLLRANEDSAYLQEAQTQARISHPNVCPIYEAGEMEGKPFISMALIDGVPLDQAAESMSLEETLKVLIQVCAGVQAAHAEGLIHRDLKPQNILVERSENGWRPFVLDFGLATEEMAPGITQTGVVKGTPSYMAPEQISGDRKHLDRRADIYALGALLYDVLSGQPPFPGESSIEVLVKTLQEEAPRLRDVVPGIPWDVEAIVAKCLEKDADARYGSARELGEDLEAFLQGRPVAARPVTFWNRSRKWAARNRVLSAVVVISGLLLATLSSVLVVQKLRSLSREKWIQQAVGEAEKMDWRMRVTFMMPEHSIEIERSRLESRLEQIEQSLEQAPAVAYGPLAYSLGRGHSILRHFAQARFWFEEARSRGFQTGDLEEGLGLVLGELFQLENQRIQGIRKAETRAVALETAIRDLRNPALESLRRADALGRSTAYAKAMMASFEDDLSSARSHLKAAAKEEPWLYEVEMLQGHLELEEGTKHYYTGRTAEAVEHIRAAKLFFEAAVTLAPSDPMVHAGLCRQVGWEMSALRKLKGDWISIGETVLATCGKVFEVDKAHGPGHLAILNALGTVATSYRWAGLDPSIVLPLGRQVAQAMKGLPGDTNPYGLGVVLVRVAEWKLEHGENPEAEFREAIDINQAEVNKRPLDARPLTNLASTLAILGEYSLTHGNPEGAKVDFLRSSEMFGRAVQLDPEDLNARLNFGTIWWSLADIELRAGNDPNPFFDKSIEVLAEAFGHGGEGELILTNNLTGLYMNRAQWLMDRGEDEGEALKEAQRWLEITLASSEPHLLTAFNEAYYHQLRLREALANDESFADSRNRLEALGQQWSDSADVLQVIAESWRYEAMAEAGSPNRSALDRGLDYALKASDLDPDLASSWTTLAHLYYARREQAGGQSRERWTIRCQQAIQKAEAIDPYEARSLQGYKAELELQAP